MKNRYHRIDGWRGYSVPATAVVGVSDTGNYSDSPCRPETGKAEIQRFRREVLRPAGIPSRIRFGQTSNVFCGKRWLCVPKDRWEEARKLALDWLARHNYELHLLHGAELEELCPR